MKRIFDFTIATSLVVCLSPLLVVIAMLIFLYDWHSPFYVAPRAGRNGRVFPMIKFRSMVVNADASGVTSTSSDDRRITPVGAFVRNFKIDELVQLINVIRGDMSLVGPRPNVPSGVALYTDEENELLSVRPGISDIASVVFSDEGEILASHGGDADQTYDRLIRPWKSRLGLLYVHNVSITLDCKLLFYTATSLVSRHWTLRRLQTLVGDLGGSEELVRIVRRETPLQPGYPPGLESC
jgi:lipopolysaccharide/colanic/teichoic acid biosynthesis glycosyltransferase